MMTAETAAHEQAAAAEAWLAMHKLGTIIIFDGSFPVAVRGALCQLRLELETHLRATDGRLADAVREEGLIQ